MHAFRHLVLVAHAAREVLGHAPLASLATLRARGRHGRVRLFPEAELDEGADTLSLLGYRAEDSGRDLSACDALGNGEEIDGAPPLESFRRRTNLRAALSSSRARSRGVARAAGLAIYPAASRASARWDTTFSGYDLIVEEVTAPPDGWTRDALEHFDHEVVRPALRWLSTGAPRRLLVVIDSAERDWCPYFAAGEGIPAEARPQPDLARGEELLPRILASFNV